MKIAISTYNNVVATVFDFADEITFCSGCGMGDIDKMKYAFHSDNIPERVQFLAQKRITHLLCGSISNVAGQLLTFHRICVISGITGHVDVVVRCFVTGKLKKSGCRLPGFRRHRRNR